MIEEFSFNEIKQKFHHVELKDQLEIEPRFSSGISILWDFQDTYDGVVQEKSSFPNG